MPQLRAAPAVCTTAGVAHEQPLPGLNRLLLLSRATGTAAMATTTPSVALPWPRPLWQAQQRSSGAPSPPPRTPRSSECAEASCQTLNTMWWRLALRRLADCCSAISLGALHSSWLHVQPFQRPAAAATVVAPTYRAALLAGINKTPPSNPTAPPTLATLAGLRSWPALTRTQPSPTGSSAEAASTWLGR